LVMRQWPSKSTPSSMTTTGASTSPKTRAEPRISTRSEPMTLPTTSPLIVTTPARIEALTTPFSPMMRVSFETISPRKRPFSMTVPVNVYFPSISEPSAMNAVRLLPLPADLALDLDRVRDLELAFQPRVVADDRHQRDGTGRRAVVPRGGGFLLALSVSEHRRPPWLIRLIRVSAEIQIRARAHGVSTSRSRSTLGGAT